jgi:hypothetical protein
VGVMTNHELVQTIATIYQLEYQKDKFLFIIIIVVIIFIFREMLETIVNFVIL